MGYLTLIVQPEASEQIQALIDEGAICLVGRELRTASATLRPDGIWEHPRPSNGGAPTKPILGISPGTAPSQIFHGVQQAADVLGCSKKAISDALQSERPISRGSAKGWRLIRQTR